MHDPLTVAFEIRNPFLRQKQVGSHKWRPPLVTIWHRDPEKRGDDDSCDWFGRRRRLSASETALEEAWSRLSHVLGNEPFYPDPRLYGREPHAEGNTAPIREMGRAFYAWRRQGRIRWHPRWHVHHWHFQIYPVQHFKRWAFSRCRGCGGRFRWGYAPISDSWDGVGPGWFRNREHVRHSECVRTRGEAVTS